MGSWSFRAPSANLAVWAFAAVALLGAAPTGAIFVSTLPSGADVWLDGTYVGRSPVVVDALAVGAHHLTLSRTGWTPEDLAVAIAPAQTQTTSVVLVRDGKTSEGSGTIVIHATERLGGVTVDGRPVKVGKDGAIAVSAGTHDVSIAAPQGKRARTVTVYPQTRTEVVLGTDAAPRSIVIAPADDYLPASALHLDGSRLVVRYGGHEVVAHIGTTTYTVDRHPATYDAPPTVIRNRIYLPLELLTMLTLHDKK
ncbi:MAG TPA: PEGA domain-containing protein [Candidatus Lustribacter sp.]